MTMTPNTNKIGQQFFFSGRYFPTPEVIVQKHGQSAAVVWGIIFGLSQIPQKKGGLGYCNAARETIASKAGVSKRTVIYKIDILVKDGWLEDLTPNRTHKPHHYVAGDKAIQSFLGGKPADEGCNDCTPDALEQDDNHLEGCNGCTPDALEQDGNHLEGCNDCIPDARRGAKTASLTPGGVQKFPSRGAESAREGCNHCTQIESLKESFNRESINKDSSSSSSSSSSSNQVISNKDEDDDEEGILQTQNQKDVSALLAAAGISAANRRKLQKKNLQLDDVLSTLAWCHNKSVSGVRKPDIITPRNLLKGDYPAATYYQPASWDRHIPDVVLEKAGLMEYVQEKIGDNGHARDDFKDNFDHEDMQPKLVFDGPPEAEQAWQTVLGQLQLEMSKAAFDAWIRDAELASFQNDTFTILVANAYTVDWLESRVKSTIIRLLTGSMGKTIYVKFDVG